MEVVHIPSVVYESPNVIKNLVSPQRSLAEHDVIATEAQSKRRRGPMENIASKI